MYLGSNKSTPRYLGDRYCSDPINNPLTLPWLCCECIECRL